MSPNSLTTLVHRLEAATSRLEDIASATVEPSNQNGQAPSSTPAAPPPPPLPTVTAPAKPKAEPLPESVEDFDTIINGSVKNFISISKEIGDPVAKQVGHTGNVQYMGN